MSCARNAITQDTHPPREPLQSNYQSQRELTSTQISHTSACDSTPNHILELATRSHLPIDLRLEGQYGLCPRRCSEWIAAMCGFGVTIDSLGRYEVRTRQMFSL